MGLGRAVLRPALYAALLASAGGAAAQVETPGLGGEAVPPQAGSESVVSYTPDYFTPYNPTNARDMVDRVPGFTRDDGEDVRGFGGAAGNVLINGERPSSKSQSAGDLLQRVRVSDVVRIDLIRGQVAGIDMGGQTVVVNVIQRSGARSGGSWRLETQYRPTSGVVRPLGQVSWNTQLAGANVTLGVQHNGNIFGEDRTEDLFSPAGAPLQRSVQERKAGFKGWIGTASADRRLGEWTVRANARIQAFNEGGNNENGITLYSSIPNPTTIYLNEFRRSTDSWEIGVDAERQLTGNLSLKLIGLQSSSKDEAGGAFSQYGLAGLKQTLSQDSESETGESILRVFLTWTPGARHSVEIGAEGAYNFLDTSQDITVDRGAGPAPVPLPVSDTKVEELRAEPYAMWLFRPNPALTIETGIKAEISRIKQTGDAQQTRDFFYPKPSASLTWGVREATQLRLGFERDVAQLSFEEFASSVQFIDNTTNIGNPDLVPQRVWRARGELEQRFWGDAVATLLAEHEWISDAQGLIPLGGGAEGPGNMGDATRWRVRLSVDTPLDRVGVPNARLTGSVEFSDSEVVDPVTGETRLLPVIQSGFPGMNGPAPYNRRSIELGFRKDHPDLGVSWGFDYQNLAPTYSFRINEVQITDPNDGALSVYVETTRIPGMTARLEAENAADTGSRRIRYLYSGPRDTAPITQIESRDIADGMRIIFTLRGNF